MNTKTPSKPREKKTSGSAQNALMTKLKRGANNTNMLKKSVIVSSLRNKYKIKPKEISKKTGISQAHVYNMLKLDAMPDVIKQYIKEGRIQETDVLELSRKQLNEKNFINTVQAFIKEKETSIAKHTDANIMRKEQLYQEGKANVPVDKKLKNKVEELIHTFAPQLSGTKSQFYTKMITQTIAAAV